MSVIVGEVRNGEQVDVACVGWSGVGAFTPGRVPLVTFVGPAPRRLPCAVTVDGTEFEAFENRPSQSGAEFTVLALRAPDQSTR